MISFSDKIIISILACLLLLSTGFAGCIVKNNETPGQIPVIQKLINQALPGDIIHIPSGTYYENIIINKSITLRGESAVSTIIDGNHSGTAITITAEKVEVSGFTIRNCDSGYYDSGVYITANSTRISNVTILNNTNIGIYLEKSHHTSITDNTIYSSIMGIYIWQSSNNTINKNTILGNQNGIFLRISPNNIIEKNTIYNTTLYGFYTTHMSENNSILNNVFRWNNYSVYIGSPQCKVIGNILENNSVGINLKGSKGSVVYNNKLYYNNMGVFICCAANNNIIYYNTFIKNSKWDAYDPFNNQWDNGTVGNYWSNYTGFDSNNDGIGDIPYNITGGNGRDRYPLMKPT
ncbi:MAG: NosD domain-containing protein [Candidatus Thermoplasmatota archaeon]